MERRTKGTRTHNGEQPSDKQKQQTLQRAGGEKCQDTDLQQRIHMEIKMARSLDLEIFERCVGKEVCIEMTGFMLFGKLTRNGEHFVEIEDALEAGAHNGNSEILKAYQKYKDGNWDSWNKFIKKFGLNKKEINSITTIDDLKGSTS